MTPGIHKISEDVYHSDPCPQPSLSGSIAIPLVHRSPLHAWWKHPRLNPDFEPFETDRLDFGSVVHKLVLGAGADVVVIDADDFKKKAAQEERAAARAAGKLPILASKFDDAQAMAAIAKPRMDDLLNGGLFSTELTLIWREGDAWCRGMVDALSDDSQVVVDYKTTGLSANPVDVERTLYDQDYHLKAAFYERGLDVLDPAGTGRRKFFFLFQEITPPFACSVLRISEGGMTIGRKQASYAIEMWQRCMATGIWPGYPTAPHMASVPPWLERQWLEREMNDPMASGEMVPQAYQPEPIIMWGD